MFWCLYILLTLNMYSATSVRTAAQEPLHYVIDIFYFLSNTRKYFSWKEVVVQSTSILTLHDSTWSISCQTMSTVGSFCLEYPLSQTSLYLELLPWSLEHFHQIHRNFLSLSRTSLSRTSLYLEQIFWSDRNCFLSMTDFYLHFP